MISSVLYLIQDKSLKLDTGSLECTLWWQMKEMQLGSQKPLLCTWTHISLALQPVWEADSALKADLPFCSKHLTCWWWRDPNSLHLSTVLSIESIYLYFQNCNTFITITLAPSVWFIIQHVKIFQKRYHEIQSLNCVWFLYEEE